MKVVAGHGEQLLARPAILLDCGVADGKKAPGFAVDREHRMGARLEQHTVEAFNLCQVLLGGFARGDVLDHSQQGRPALKVDRPHGRLDIDDPPILRSVPYPLNEPSAAWEIDSSPQ